MALPPALAARLKKRGILRADSSAHLESDPTEEIIAADYSGDIQPDLSKEQIIIDNDNVPHGWWKVKDPPSGFAYYWDSNTDMVSWLSPIDSKANISLSANKLREIEEKRIRLREAQPKAPGTEPANKVNMNVEIGPIIPASVPLPPPRNPPPRSGGERSRRDHRGSRGKRQKEELDPMDPSSYSDTPRGTWSSGLPSHQDAKTGVDVTANGPLFQSRPYPSPGAILRANKGNAPLEPSGPNQGPGT